MTSPAFTAAVKAKCAMSGPCKYPACGHRAIPEGVRRAIRSYMAELDKLGKNEQVIATVAEDRVR